MRFYRDLSIFEKIHRNWSPITMPSFIMFYISLKSLYFMGFARFPKMTGHHSGHHSIYDGIKFYTTFNASATRSISRCFSSSVICTYRFIVMPILECPNIFCNPFSKFFSFEIFSHFEAPFQAKSP